MSRLSLVAKYFLFNLNILILSNVLLILKNYVSRYFAAVRTVKYFLNQLEKFEAAKAAYLVTFGYL